MKAATAANHQSRPFPLNDHWREGLARAIGRFRPTMVVRRPNDDAFLRTVDMADSLVRSVRRKVEEPKMNWKAVHVGIEGDDAQIEGLKLWETEWRRVAIDPIQLPHPAHPHEVRSFLVFEIGSEIGPMRFAGAELSANVWGFYAPE